jgi:hypothetical protein
MCPGEKVKCGVHTPTRPMPVVNQHIYHNLDKTAHLLITAMSDDSVLFDNLLRQDLPSRLPELPPSNAAIRSNYLRAFVYVARLRY